MLIRILSYPAGKEGFTQIKANTNGIEKMRTSSLIAQTPLPTKSKKVTVVGGKTIVTEMLNEGFVMNEIEDIRIDIHGRLVAKVYKSLSLRQHGTLKRMELGRRLLNLKQKNIRQNQSMDRKQREVTQMDFKRSAVVLIVCFFILDLFLFGLVWQKRSDEKSVEYKY